MNDTESAVRTILNTIWNPIGITMTADDDEYDDYMRIILQKNWTEKELQDFLLYTIRVTIGLSVYPEHKEATRKAVAALMQLLAEKRA